MSGDTLRNQFLIAMPDLGDENFNKSVSVLCEHSSEGALGLVINRPTDLRLREMLEHLELDSSGLRVDAIVYWGGPVQTERGFVLHSPIGDWDSSIRLNANIAVTTSRDILIAIGQGAGPERFQVMLGYAGWEAGQLERELLENAWLNISMREGIIFDTPNDQRWAAATRLLGVDPASLVGGAGHA